MARKIALGVVPILVALLLAMIGAAPAVAAPYEPLRTEDTACDTVGQFAGAVADAIPGGSLLSGLVDDTASNLCEDPTDPGGALVGAVGEQFSEAWESKFGEVVSWLVDGMGQLLIMAMSWWIQLPSPDLQNMTALQAISEYTFEIQLILLVASIIFVTVRMAQARRQARAGEAEETFRVLVRTVFAASLYSTLIVVLMKAGDGFSLWVVNETSNNDPNGAVNSMVALSTASAVSPGLIFIVALVGLLGALLQAILLVVRQAMLIVAVAALPVAAAAGGTQIGRQTYQKITAWIIAFLLYKPVAALAYAIAFLAATSGGDFFQVLLGIILLCSTAAILPSLMRLITPAVAAVGSGGSGASALGGALMAGAAVATGGTSLAAGKAVQGAGAAGAFSGGGGGAGVALAGGSRGPGGRGPSGGAGASSRQPPQSGPTRGGRGRETGAGARSGKTAATTAATTATRSTSNTQRDQGRGDMGRHTIRQ